MNYCFNDVALRNVVWKGLSNAHLMNKLMFQGDAMSVCAHTINTHTNSDGMCSAFHVRLGHHQLKNWSLADDSDLLNGSVDVSETVPQEGGKPDIRCAGIYGLSVVRWVHVRGNGIVSMFCAVSTARM